MPYESTPEDIRRAWLLAVFYVLLVVILGLMLFKIWPPTPWPGGEDFQNTALKRAFSECGYPMPTPTPASIPSAVTIESKPTADIVPATIPIRFFGKICLNTSFDERLILLVIIAGVLGSFIHAATSLADYIGNNNFNRNWSWFYLLRPFIGMALALVFYFVIRAGFLTTSGGAEDINPYGIAALAGLVGMFSKQATDKLNEVFTTFFRSAPGEGDDKRKNSLAGEEVPRIHSVEPSKVVAGSKSQTVVVTGTGFENASKVYLNDAQQATEFESETRLKATLADKSIAQADTLKLKVVNSDDIESTSTDFVVI